MFKLAFLKIQTTLEFSAIYDLIMFMNISASHPPLPTRETNQAVTSCLHHATHSLKNEFQLLEVVFPVWTLPAGERYCHT